MNRRADWFDICNVAVLSLLALACVYPFWNILVISLSSGHDVMAGKVYLYPIGWNLEAYKHILGSDNLGVMRGLVNSLLYASAGTAFAVALTYMTAYCLSRRRFVGRYPFMLMILFTMIFDGGLIPNFLVLKSLGFVNSPLVMIIPSAISVFLLIVARSYLESQPVELEESAFMDGANDFQIMRSIFLPVCTPIIATIALFYAVQIWNAYLMPLIYLQDKSLHPIQLVLQQLVIDTRSGSGAILETVTTNNTTMFPRNLQAAVIFFAMFPILIVYPFAQKYFTKGLLIGSVKG